MVQQLKNKLPSIYDISRNVTEGNLSGFKIFPIRHTIVRKKVAMIQLYLKYQGPYRMTTNSFGDSKSSMSATLRLVTEDIVKMLEPQYIHLPSGRLEVQEATTALEVKFGFPQVLGFLDGTHILKSHHLPTMITSVIKCNIL